MIWASMLMRAIRLRNVAHAILSERRTKSFWTRCTFLTTSRGFTTKSTDSFSVKNGNDGLDSLSGETSDVNRVKIGKIEFPDPNNPRTNPLASISSEGLQNDGRLWKIPKPGPTARIYVRKINENGVAFGRGGRKCSFAGVWIREGTGIVTVNGRSWVDYFPSIYQRDKILWPMHLVGMTGRFDLRCKVTGGGQTGQAEAIRFCLARALQNWEPTWRPTLKKNGLLTRDSRIVEPKKYGRKKARKSFQWVKR